jgi:hypothetical protein
MKKNQFFFARNYVIIKNKKQMIERCPYDTKSTHLLNALNHRRLNNFPLALQELTIAYNEPSNIEAKDFMWYVHFYGGFGIVQATFTISDLFHNRTPNFLMDIYTMQYAEFREFLIKCVETRYLFTPFLFMMHRDYYLVHDDVFKPYVELCCQWNDSYILYLTMNFNNLLLSINQNVHYAFQPVIDTYQALEKYVKAAKIIVRRTNPNAIYRNMKYALSSSKIFSTDREKQCFVFGRWLSKRNESERLKPIFTNSIRIYQETIEKVERTLKCWIWACKKMGWFYRDLMKMIGNLLWESREDPQAWGIGLERKSGRRVKKKGKK